MALKPGWEGRYLEDFEVGDVYRSSIGRTITDAENTIVTLLTNNEDQGPANARRLARLLADAGLDENVPGVQGMLASPNHAERK